MMGTKLHYKQKLHYNNEIMGKCYLQPCPGIILSPNIVPSVWQRFCYITYGTSNIIRKKSFLMAQIHKASHVFKLLEGRKAQRCRITMLIRQLIKYRTERMSM